MSREPENLLTILHGWASLQDENFTTEAFAHLLRQLLAYAPAVGIDLIHWLTDNSLVLRIDHALSTSIRTQVWTKFGRPDIEIRTANAIAYIEVKVESCLGDQQLHRYLEHLDSEDVEYKSLVLLSRYSEEIADDISKNVVFRRWFQVAIELERLMEQHSPCGSIVEYLIVQYVDFLKGRGMTIDRVTWEMTEGVKSFRNLMEMLRKSIESTGWKFDTCFDKAMTYWGFYMKPPVSTFGPSPFKVYVGCGFLNPSVLRFRTEELEIRSDADQFLGFGKLESNKDNKNRPMWVHELKLDSEDVHFFALSRERQLQVLERFVRDSIEAAMRIHQVDVGQAPACLPGY